MTLSANQEKIASILLEYEDTRKILVLKNAEAERAGQMFLDLGQMLKSNPSLVFFPGDIPEVEIPSGMKKFDSSEIIRFAGSLADVTRPASVLEHVPGSRILAQRLHLHF